MKAVRVSGYNTDYVDDLLILPLSRKCRNKIYNISDKEFLKKYILIVVSQKLAKGIYSDEEIKKEIEEHKNPKTNSDYKK